MVCTLSRLAPFLGALLASAAGAQQFSEAVPAYMPLERDPGLAIAAADVDGDGHIDFVVGNNAIARAWQNRLYLGDGRGQFRDATATHLPVGRYRTSGVALGDVDGDGDPDLVTANTFQNRLYLNDGTGRFAEATFGRLPVDVEECREVVLRDLDGDGDLDLAFASHRQDLLYLNDGQGRFSDVTATHMVVNATSTWDIDAADVDGDGDVDLLLAEQIGQLLLLNDGGARFTPAPNGSLPTIPVPCQTNVFGDVDGDGDQDLVSSYSGAAPTVFLNDGSGAFGDATAGNLSTTAFYVEEMTLGDVDGDGDVDLVMACWFDRWTPGRRLHLNDGSGRFTDVSTSQLLSNSPNWSSALLLTDVDADGDLDLASADYWSRDRLMLNDGAGVFARSSPTRLHGAMEVPRGVVLADLDGDGDRDLVFANTFFDWQNWPNRLHLNDGRGWFADATSGRLPDDADDSRGVVAVDVEGDGDLDLLFGNHRGQNKLYLNDGSAVFTDVTATQMPALVDATTAIAAGDLTGDGLPDLVVTSHLEATAAFFNDGSGAFQPGPGGNLPPAVHEVRGVTLGDVDGDGDLDIVLAVGLTDGARNRLYLNDGAGAFTDATVANMPNSQLSSASVALGDVDGDGDLDMVFGNDSAGLTPSNELYLGDGNGVFVSAWLVIDADDTLAIALADVDDDGDLDVLCGDHGSYNKLYLNDGTGTFSDGTNRLSGKPENTRVLATGDVDGDGDVDLVAGNEGSVQLESVVHINHHRQLDAPRLAAIGEVFQLDVYSRPGYATAQQGGVLWLGTAPASVVLPPYGVFGIHPSTMVQLPLPPLAPPAGKATVMLPIPNLPILVGIELWTQVIVTPTANVADARLTNVLRSRINAF